MKSNNKQSVQLLILSELSKIDGTLIIKLRSAKNYNLSEGVQKRSFYLFAAHMDVFGEI